MYLMTNIQLLLCNHRMQIKIKDISNFKFAFVIIFEHVVFGVCKLIDILVPDIPASLDVKMKRERFLAKEALQDAEHVLQVREDITNFKFIFTL